MAKRRSKFKVVNRKLGREKAWGQCWGDNVIEIDPRQSSKEYFSTLCHEIIHGVFAYKELSEEEVLAAEKIIVDILWDQGYRKVNL